MTNPLRRVKPAGAGPDTPPPTRDTSTPSTRPPRDTVADYRPANVSFVAWPGADVRLAINAGTFVPLPIRDQRMIPGDVYQLTFRSPGRHDYVENFAGLAPGQNVTYELTPDMMPARAGVLVVLANARGAMVSVDGGAAVPSPFSGVFREGSHAVKVSAPGFQTETLEATVTDGRTARVVVSMVAAGVPRVAWVAAAILAGAMIGTAIAVATPPAPPQVQQPALPPSRHEDSQHPRGARRRRTA